jgi:hypothetical protein
MGPAVSCTFWANAGDGAKKQNAIAIAMATGHRVNLKLLHIGFLPVFKKRNLKLVP